ncbi:hypothetical protein [Undibacterium sp.]|uniref:hypothetical protein n=1 Tax=Undibacterium sp. TaxID=1914977 RepID=UPI00374D06F2
MVQVPGAIADLLALTAFRLALVDVDAGVDVEVLFFSGLDFASMVLSRFWVRVCCALPAFLMLLSHMRLSFFSIFSCPSGLIFHCLLMADAANAPLFPKRAVLH